jgi:biotin synthase-like enzyme|tara:strand:+ start:2165 stop:3157 length:993 start_codon:yes stop_codon:yes gene_type:complete
MQDLIKQAKKVYNSNFSSKVTFERAVFFSWGCTIGDCTFCYMSTQPLDKVAKETKRSNASILAEFLLAKHLGWDIGFFTGGIGVLKPDELEFLLKIIYQITGEKIWLSVGPLPKTLLEKYLPYIRGVVGSTETINPVLHKKVCPSKPLKPYEVMFENAKKLDLDRAMTFIVGMGETRKDFKLLKNFITKYDISKIHVYGLIPQRGTPFENSSIPTKEEQAWWIANLRIAFPKLDIQCGIWEDRIERISYLLDAGSNSISKFKALKLFGTSIARQIEEQATLADRKFVGTLSKMPEIDWNQKINSLEISKDLKRDIRKKLDLYLQKMTSNQ